MPVAGIDHAAIPTTKPEAMLRFYRALGFAAPSPEEWLEKRMRSFSLVCGNNKINVHAPGLWLDPGFTLRGPTAQPGCGDFCFVWEGTVEDLQATLKAAGAVTEVGPVERIGGRAGGSTRGMSIYTRDPDRNLIEFIVYPDAPAAHS